MSPRDVITTHKEKPMEAYINKNEEPRQSTPQNDRSIKNAGYIYSDENNNPCGGIRVHEELAALIHPLTREEFLDLELDPIKAEEQDQRPRLIGDIIEDLKPEILNAPPKKLFKRIITHPIADLHRYVDADSIDMIITEPPCKEEDIDLFDQLGDFARHALKDGGICVVISGNRYSIDFMEMLHAHLDYVWTLSLDAAARRYEAPSGSVIKLWKPVLIFSKGSLQLKIFSDVKESVENIVHTFSNAGDVVCDPFCNQGGISKICVENGRSLIANDIDISKTEALKGVLL
jgi:hypothetical protein